MMKFKEIEKERKNYKKSVENPQASCFRVFATFFYPIIWWNIMSLLNFANKMEQKLCSKVFTMLKDSEFRKLAKENSLCLLPKFHKLLSFRCQSGF